MTQRDDIERFRWMLFAPPTLNYLPAYMSVTATTLTTKDDYRKQERNESSHAAKTREPGSQTTTLQQRQEGNAQSEHGRPWKQRIVELCLTTCFVRYPVWMFLSLAPQNTPS